MMKINIFLLNSFLIKMLNGQYDFFKRSVLSAFLGKDNFLFVGIRINKCNRVDPFTIAF